MYERSSGDNEKQTPAASVPCVRTASHAVTEATSVRVHDPSQPFIHTASSVISYFVHTLAAAPIAADRPKTNPDAAVIDRVFFRRRRRVGQNAAAHSYTPRASNRVGGRPPGTTNRLSGLGAGGCLQPASTHINEISDRDHCAWLARHGDAKAGLRARPVSA